MGGNGPQAGTHPCHFTPPRREGPEEELKRPGTWSQARERAGKQNTAPPKQSPDEICKLITVLGNLSGDTTQDASCSAEIREFPGSHCPASPGGQKNWQGAWWNVRKMPEAKTAGSSAPCTPRPVPFTLHSPLESPLRLTFKPSLPLAGCGALGKWLCLFVPQFPHLQNGAAGGERLPAFLHILL